MNLILIYLIVAIIIFGSFLLLGCNIYVKKRVDYYALYSDLDEIPKDPVMRLGRYKGTSYLFSRLKFKDEQVTRINMASLRENYTSFQYQGPHRYNLTPGSMVLMANLSLRLEPSENDLIVLVQYDEMGSPYYSVRQIKLKYRDEDEGISRYWLDTKESSNEETETTDNVIEDSDILGILIFQSA